MHKNLCGIYKLYIFEYNFNKLKLKKMKFITEYDKQIRKQSETFEDRLCEAIIEGNDLDSLMEEAKEIKRVGFFTPSEYKTLTNIELYKEMIL